MTREDFDRKYFIAKSGKQKNEACLEYIYNLERELEALQAKIKELEELQITGNCGDCKHYKQVRNVDDSGIENDCALDWCCRRAYDDEYKTRDDR